MRTCWWKGCFTPSIYMILHECSKVASFPDFLHWLWLRSRCHASQRRLALRRSLAKWCHTTETILTWSLRQWMKYGVFGMCVFGTLSADILLRLSIDSCKLQDAYLASQGLMGLTAHLALDSPAAVLSYLVPVLFTTIIWLLCSCMVEVNMVKQTCTASRLPNARSIEDVPIILVFWLRTLV